MFLLQLVYIFMLFDTTKNVDNVDKIVDTLFFGTFNVYNSTYFCEKVKNNAKYGLHN